jgi:ketosteroid isomerase-like protein
MVDVLEAIGEACVEGDGPRLRRLFTEDATIESVTGARDLTVDDAVALHETERPFASWQRGRFVALDASHALLTATVAFRLEHGVSLRRCVYLCRFRDGRVSRVTTHADLEAAQEAYEREAAAGFAGSGEGNSGEMGADPRQPDIRETQPPVPPGDESMPSDDPGDDDAQRREAAERAAGALEGDASEAGDAGATGRE